MLSATARFLQATKGDADVKRWPLIQEQIEKAVFTYLDFALASALLGEEGSEGAAYLLCTLSCAVRAGHLCIEVGADSCQPSLKLLGLAESAHSIFMSGKEALPLSLFEKGWLHLEGDRLYFQKYWQLERQLLADYAERIQMTPEIVIPFDRTCLIDIEEEQQKAIEVALQSCLSFIAGGPGTGKTYTAGQLLRAYWIGLEEKDRAHACIALAAPTGKAAANLQQSMQQATADLESFTPIQAETLHRLLHIGKREVPPLMADLILVDESSMIDVKLMAALFHALKPGARLVLIGDPYQLPPVEAGSLFSDMMTLQGASVTYLKRSLRTDHTDLLQLAEAVLSGDCQAALHHLHPKPLSSLQELPPFPNFGEEKDPTHYLRHFQQFRLLSPFRKGPFGVDAINAFYQQKAQEQLPPGALPVFPIILTSNDIRLGLFNGDVGVLMGDRAYFQSREGELMRELPAIVLPKYSPAYCLSVHQSQGSEYEHICLVLPEGSERFGREMLYTALTRAKKVVTLFADVATLEATMSVTSKRFSGLTKK